MNNYAVRRRAIVKATASIPIPRFTPHACEANGGQEFHYWGGACLLTPRVGQITEQTRYKIRK